MKQIKNNKLKELVENSFMYISMTPPEKEEFLAWVVENQENAVIMGELTKALETEKKELLALANDPSILATTPEEKEESNNFVLEQYAELKKDTKVIKKEVLKENEKASKKQEKSALDNLLNSLNKNE